MDYEHMQITAKTVVYDSGAIGWKVYLSDGDMKIAPKKGTNVLQQGVMKQDAFSQMVKDASVVKKDHAFLQIPPTPKGFVDGYLSTEPGTLGGVFVMESARSQFALKSNEKLEGSREEKLVEKAYCIPMPNLVYYARFDKGHLQEMLCYAFREWNGMDTELCQYPFGNVSNSGYVCTGSVPIVAEDIRTFADVLSAIIDTRLAVTNDDHLADSKVRLLKDMTQIELCDSLIGKDTFPHELLLDFHDSIGPENRFEKENTKDICTIKDLCMYMQRKK